MDLGALLPVVRSGHVVNDADRQSSRKQAGAVTFGEKHVAVKVVADTCVRSPAVFGTRSAVLARCGTFVLGVKLER
jgi:hypothetical protein